MTDVLIITSVSNDYFINVPSQTGSILSIKNSVEGVSGIRSDLQQYFHSGKILTDYSNYDLNIMSFENPLQLAEKKIHENIPKHTDSRRRSIKRDTEHAQVLVHTDRSISYNWYSNPIIKCEQVNPNWKIENLIMEKAFGWLERDPEEAEQHFENRKVDLNDCYHSQAFGDFEITRSQSIQVLQKNPCEGGGPCPMAEFDFNSCETQIEREFSEDAPEWRIVGKGISFKGRCTNSNCQAYNQNVIDCKGFGVFELGRILNHCPMKNCKSLIQAANCGFYKAKWIFDGITSTGQQKKGEGKADSDKYTTFKEGDSIKWRSIRIGVFPLI